MTPEFLDQQLNELLFQSTPPYSQAEVRSMCAVLIRSMIDHYATRCDALIHRGRMKWTDDAALHAIEDLAATLHADLAALD